ncbi:MAG: alginate export family protein [Planctomycetota bacterium]
MDRETGTWVHATGLPIRTGAAGAGTHLADEIDLTAKWSATKSFTLLIGYSIFLPGGFIESTGDDPIAQFFYIQGHLKF